MKTTTVIQTRTFHVKILDTTGAERDDTITLTLDQLQAAQIVGQSSKELIERLADRQGLTVLDIGKAVKREISLNLGELYRLHERATAAGRE